MRSERYTPRSLKEALAREERTGAWLARRTGISSSLMEKVLRGERTLNREAAERVALVLRSDIFLLFDVAPARNDRADESFREAVA